MRLGEQRPRVRCIPPGIVSTDGPRVADFMRMVGKPLLPWQRDVCDIAFARRADGKWAAYEVAVWLARQNGKGVITEAQELFGAYMLRERKIIHSAHEFDTAGEAFQRLVEIIEGSDWLRARTAKIVRGKGSEGIELTRAAGGGEIRFKARTAHGARGFSGDRIILDEAYALTVSHMKAMSPVLATIPNCQITYTSSPPDEKTGPMPEDAMAPSIRRRGLQGDDPRLASFEWSPEGEPDPGNIDSWYACNPSLGYLIDEEFLASQYRIFDAAGKPTAFATEHLGRWPEEDVPEWQVFDRKRWFGCTDAESTVRDPVAFAVALSEDRRWATVLAAGRRTDGRLHVEIAARAEGAAWVVPRVLELCQQWKPAAVVVDKGTPAGQFAPDLVEAGVELTLISKRDTAAAAGAMAAMVAEDRLRHRGDPVLTVSAAKAATRGIGNTWEFELSSGAFDISPLAGAANALWGYTTRVPEVVQPFFATRR